jgi:cell wall-associated NlpC family hydrolase
MRQLDNGDRGEDVSRLQRSINRRLETRKARNRQIKVDGEFGLKTRDALHYASFLLGLSDDKLKALHTGSISVEEQRFVMNPGMRDENELTRARKRVAAHIRVVNQQLEDARRVNARRRRIVAEAERAAANYRRNPGAYHYLAGGVQNLIYLRPSPRNYRSDCSQFVASVYKAAGLPSPASVDHIWASTYTMVKGPHVRFIDKAQRKPGDLGMYGSREAPHHVEIWCGNKFIGHGSPPIDSLTPGEPDYYLTFDFLN